MVRVLGGRGDPATRLENRIGEPAANPYLHMASQVLSGLDGMKRNLDPGPSADTPYETQAPLLPRSLSEALDALRSDDFFRGCFGSVFVDYYLHIKEAEIARFQLEVTGVGAARVFRDALNPAIEPITRSRRASTR
jgi:glutamine synthetase